MTALYTLKNTTKRLADGLRDYFRDAAKRIKTIERRTLISRTLMNLVICVAFSLFCSLREGTYDLYMSVFIPVFCTNMIVILFSLIYRSSDVYAISVVLLITAGTALQIFMCPTDSDSAAHAYKYALISLAGAVLSIFAVPLISILFKNNRKAIRLSLGIAIALLYMFLLIAGEEIAGTKAWVNLLGISIQVTDIAKLLTTVYFVLCLFDDRLSEKKKCVSMFKMLCINAMFLSIANELGTLVLIIIVLLFSQILLIKKKKYIIIEFVCLTAIAALILTTSFVLSNSVPQQASSSHQTVSSESSGNTKAEEKKDDPSPVDKIVSRIARIYPKFQVRIRTFLHSDGASRDDTFQIDMATKALAYVSLFGTPRGSLGTIPEISSDFVFIYLLVRIGLIGTALIMIALASMLIVTSIGAARSDSNPETACAAIFTFGIVFQSLLCACSNLGVFPVVGLPFAFLSSGGSAICINLIMCIFTLYSLRSNKVTSEEV